MKTILTCLLSSILYFSSVSQTFTTLTSGNWNNTTNVWSTNGVTPCGCFPGNNLNADTLKIGHALTLTAHLSATTLSSIQVDPGGSMNNSLFDVSISNSIVLANGNVNIKKLTILAGGNFQLQNSILVLNGNSDIYGILQTTNSTIHILTGNIQVFPGATAQLNSGTHIHFSNGNYRNEGTTNICSSCCISFDKGSVLNTAGSSMNGSGSLLVNAGSIKNYGTWNPSITWCASGADVGMTSPENCSLSNQICTFGPLAMELLSFDGWMHPGFTELIWVVSSANHALSYTIEQYQTTESWKVISEPFNSESLDNAVRYRMEVTIPDGNGIYRLTARNQDGTTEFVAHASPKSFDSEEIIVYPNPFDEGIIIKAAPYQKIKEAVLLDLQGRQCAQMQLEDFSTVPWKPDVKAGCYQLAITFENETKFWKICKN
jgi:hypothetical protein